MKNIKFVGAFELVPADHPSYPEGYLKLEGVEYPGSSAPGGMNVQDWVIYKANYDAATKQLPEGGVEGEASFIQEHPGEEYLGDVVHDHDFIWIWKGAASSVAKAQKIVEDLQSYPILDESLHSQIEDEAINEEINGWALREARGMFGYDKHWSDLLTGEEAAWLAQLSETNPGAATEVENQLESIFELEGDQEQKFRQAIRDGLTYGDWTVVHKEPMIELLQREAPELVDPAATMHQFLKQEMQNATPGSAADMKKKEDAGQLRLLESLRMAQQVLGGKREIRQLVEAGEAVTKAKSVANMVAKIVGGHLAVEAAGGGFFTYPVKGRLMGALLKAHAGDSFGLSWAPMDLFNGSEDAAKVLAEHTMLSFDTTTKLKVISGSMTEIKSQLVAGIGTSGADGAKDDIAPSTLGGHPVKAKSRSKFKRWAKDQGYREHAGADLMCSASRQRIAFWAKTPKGFEPVVKELKKKGDVANPWAVAWSMKNLGIRPKASKIGAGIENDDEDARFAKYEAMSNEALAQMLQNNDPNGSYVEALEEIKSDFEGQPELEEKLAEDRAILLHYAREVHESNRLDWTEEDEAQFKKEEERRMGKYAGVLGSSKVKASKVEAEKIFAGDMDFTEKKEWLDDADPKWFKGEGQPTEQQIQEAFDLAFGPFDKGDVEAKVKADMAQDTVTSDKKTIYVGVSGEDDPEGNYYEVQAIFDLGEGEGDLPPELLERLNAAFIGQSVPAGVEGYEPLTTEDGGLGQFSVMIHDWNDYKRSESADANTGVVRNMVNLVETILGEKFQDFDYEVND